MKREAEEAKARALQVERERQEESERAAAALAAAKAEQKRLEQAKEEELIRLHAMEQAHREAEDARRDDQRRAAAQAEQLAAEAEQARADRESSAKLAELATAAEASRVRALEKCERIKAMIQRLLHDPGFPETPDGRAFDIRTGLPYLAPDSKETPEGVVLEPKSCKGFLVKRGGFHKNLTRRWFSFDLVAKELAYFKVEKWTSKRPQERSLSISTFLHSGRERNKQARKHSAGQCAAGSGRAYGRGHGKPCIHGGDAKAHLLHARR